MKNILSLLLSLAALLMGGGSAEEPAVTPAPTPASAQAPVTQDWVLNYQGDWVLWDDGCSSLRMTDFGPEGIHFSVSFYRMAAFEFVTDASDSKVTFFSGTDSPSFAGQIAFEYDSITLYTYNDLGIFDGWFDSRVFTFRRPFDQGVRLTAAEIEEAISAIRDAYYSPTAADGRVKLPVNEQGYARDFTYHNGEPVFAFVYRGLEEHRFYYLNGRLIRYIDENHITYDLEDVLPYTRWGQEILREAWENAPQQTSAAIPDWLGTWASPGGETLIVLRAGEDSITLIYNGYTASGGSMFHSEYTMEYDNAEKTSASEPYSVLQTAGWRYTVIYEGDHITLRSRYPDKIFYKQ